MTIKQFNQLATKRYADQHPAVPPHAIPPAKYSDKNTNELTKAVIAFIEYHGGQAERISVEGRVIDKRKTFTDVLGRTRTVGNIKRVRSSGKKGSADISATIPVTISGRSVGLSVKIEIKFSKSDKQRPDQIKYEQTIRNSSGYYFIVKTFDDFVNKYSELIAQF